MVEAGCRDRPIFFVGPRACGKTTIGARLARRMALPFEDTDILLQRELDANVAQIVAERGWEYFRERESSVLRETAARFAAGGVIATGGGMVLKRENRAFMRSAGRVFFLSVPVGALLARLAADPKETQRPPLTGLSSEAEAARILAEREPLYREAAHHVLDAACPPEEVCRKIFEILKY
ncbi:MAG: shikimate kinase AroL [Desulfovibrio sp.]|jgi:shikimate kinase|nr:shikimate kinase AroL [Desulfovibrio sp.]